MYGILKAEGILLPRYAVLNRDPNNPQGNRYIFITIVLKTSFLQSRMLLNILNGNL